MDIDTIIKNQEEHELAVIEQNYSVFRRSFHKNDIIMRHTDTENMIGIIVKGLAFLLSVTEDGETSIIDYYEKGSVFGKCLAPDSDINLYYIIAKNDCHVIFLTHEKLENNEPVQFKAINSLITRSFRRCQMHIDILSCRSIRGKLTAYLKYMRNKKNSDEFELPLSLSDLADYLSVDRSAMMREIKKMKDQNIITVKNSRKITLNL